MPPEIATPPSPHVKPGTPEIVQERVLRNRWFASFGPALQAAVWSASQAVSARCGEVIYQQGAAVRAATDGFFVLLSGQLKVSSGNDVGDEAIVTFINPGSWFGELALVEPVDRVRTVACLADSELRVISKADFDALMQNAEFAQRIAELIASRTRLLLSLQEDAALRTMRARVARRLVLLSHGDDMRNGYAFRELAVSHDALALMLGSSRQSVATQMAALRDAGAVAQRYGRILITSDVALLAAAASQ